MDRIAKIIARAGICSRRDAEKLVFEGRVTFQNKIIDNIASKFQNLDGIKVDGKPLEKDRPKLWLYHKPIGTIVSHKDEQGRETMFDQLSLKSRVVSIGRLDKNTSGLILLTNDGELARKFELPSSNIERVYLVRIFGNLNFKELKTSVSRPIKIDGEIFKPIEVSLENKGTHNHWLRLTLKEGKNREIRKILSFFGYKISRLIRIKYGPYELGDLKPNEYKEVNIQNF